MKRLNTGTVPLILIALAACSEQSGGPSAPGLLPPTGISAARGGPSDPTATWKIPLADAGLSLKSDHLFNDTMYSAYADGTCGVAAKIFATTAFSNTGDATIQMSYPSGHKCGRTITLVYPDSATETLATFSNLNQLQNTNPATVIHQGESALRRLIVGFQVSGLNNPTSSRCGRVIFGDNGNVGSGTDQLLVTRIDARTWRVQSQPAPNNRALCESLGIIYPGMVLDFLVVASADLPT